MWNLNQVKLQIDIKEELLVLLWTAWFIMHKLENKNQSDVGFHVFYDPIRSTTHVYIASSSNSFIKKLGMRSYLLFQMNIIFLRFEVRYLYTQLVTKKYTLIEVYGMLIFLDIRSQKKWQ